MKITKVSTDRELFDLAERLRTAAEGLHELANSDRAHYADKDVLAKQVANLEVLVDVSLGHVERHRAVGKKRGFLGGIIRIRVK